jgi:hypothetical protein
MKILSIENSEDTPKVVLNKDKGVFEISGRSIPEDSTAFYKPVLEWIEDYKKAPNPTTKFSFNFEYLNTSSSKLVQEILSALENLEGATIIWNYKKNDDDMKEIGEDFSSLTSGIAFEFKPY